MPWSSVRGETGWIIKPFKNAYNRASRRENISGEVSGTDTGGPHYQPNASREFHVLAYPGWRLVWGRDMYVEGFDVETVAKRLRAEYSVEEALPLQIRLMLAHLIRAESEHTQSLSVS